MPDDSEHAVFSLSTTLILLSSLARADGLADAGGPYFVDAEGIEPLDGSDSEVDECDAVLYRWDNNGDGVLSSSYSEDPEDTFSAVGIDGPAEFVVTLEVTCVTKDADVESEVETDEAEVFVQSC